MQHSLGWDILEVRRHLSAATIMYKAVHNRTHLTFPTSAGAPNDQFVVKCIIIPQLMKINVIKAFSGVFSVAGKTLSVPFSQQDTQEISQPAR